MKASPTPAPGPDPLLKQPWLFPELALTPPTPVRRPPRAPRANGELSFCVLGSGSGGNASLLRYRGASMLIDAGLGPRTLAARLSGLHQSVHELRALCLTHLDRDHFRPSWLNTLIRGGVRVHLHKWHEPELQRIPGSHRLYRSGLVQCFDEQEPIEPLRGVNGQVLRLRHDQQGTSGFRFTCPAGSVGYATDLGHVPAQLIELFTGVDVLAIESNYDPPMQRSSSRPLFVQRRNLSDAGHLSNAQAFEAVCRIAERSPEGRPEHVVLLHRSAQCNTPHLVRSTFRAHAQIYRRVVLAEQRRRTRWLHVRPKPAGGQMMLFA